MSGLFDTSKIGIGTAGTHCRDCGVPLLRVEATYYLFRCERCEREAHEELQAWRGGEPSKRLDDLFGAEIQVTKQ